MTQPHWLRKTLTAGVILAVAVGVLAPASFAAAVPPSYAADLPDLGTPAVAYDRAFQPTVTGVAVRGADGSLLYSARSGSAFGPLQSLGGAIVGDPSVVVTSAGTHFFVRGTDDQVYTNTITPSGAVSGYAQVPGLTVTGDVEALVPNLAPAGSLRIFARGTDGAVWTNNLNGGAWSGWSSLGGFATSDITAARTFAFPNDTVRVFIRGADHRVYVNRVSASGVTGFEPLGELQVTSNIAVAEDAVFGGGFIAARGADNGLWTLNLFSIPYTWRSLGGTVTSDIALSSQPNVTALYSRGTDNALYVNKATSSDAVYRGFERIDGTVTGNPAAFGTGPNAPGTGFLLARLAGGSLGLNVEPSPTVLPPHKFGGYTPIPGPAVS
ncbi:hypothetical protein ACIBQX_20050 [Nonomuraea sp. NPDC049714]|uniref:hypothetical protein n=1 Tax=Nonomuraea sp. NPDC049714 TaxID=3364357 RepID=UPI0037958030